MAKETKVDNVEINYQIKIGSYLYTIFVFENGTREMTDKLLKVE
ncbi:hypothetical protein [Paenibacillus sp. ATY16]|nr:hypothetical protein [Paenibacillus sp. ATY16]